MHEVINGSIRETILKVKAFCEKESGMKAQFIIPFDKVDALATAIMVKCCHITRN